MVRTIEVEAGAVRIVARICFKNGHLTRMEIDRVRDQLADRLQTAVANLVYIGVPQNRVIVK